MSLNRVASSTGRLKLSCVPKPARCFSTLARAARRRCTRCWMAVSNSSMVKGLVMKSSAPKAMPWRIPFKSVSPVISTNGRSAVVGCCRSTAVMA